MCTPNMIAKILLIVGGLNWGLVGAFDFNLVNTLLGSWPLVERIVYVIVGLSALVVAAHVAGMCKKCATACANCGSTENKPAQM